MILLLFPKYGHEAGSCSPPHCKHDRVAADTTESTEEIADAIESTELADPIVSTELSSDTDAFLSACSRALKP